MDALHQTHRWLWQPYAGPLMAKCGDKPKLLAIGIAPHPELEPPPAAQSRRP